jgi:Tol biopolymer transport system component
MATGGKTYLMEGDIAARSMRAVRENVECPSLSPDGTRIAYKHQIGEQRGNWRLHVLDLGTGKDTALAEKRVVDDQAEWVDDQTVAYGLDGAVWSVPADGSGAPQPLLRDALSPSAVN